MSETRERLRKGARILGELHRKGLRCSAGWSFDLPCTCASRTKFCAARDQWVKLVCEGDADNKERDFAAVGPYSLFEVMLGSEFKETGLRLLTDAGTKVAPAAVQSVMSMTRAVKEVPDAAEALRKIVEVFPGAEVIGLEGGRL